jgi:hypothetical protein
MKYSISAQRAGLDDLSAGHNSAASALANVTELKLSGASQIQVFDIKTGRLVDEAGLARAEAQDRLMTSRRPPLRSAG